MDHLIHDLTDHNRRGEQLKACAGVLNRQHRTHRDDRHGTGIGHQGGEADQHGEQDAVGNVQGGEHQELTTTEDQRQHHLAGEIAPKGALEGRLHQIPPTVGQPAGQTVDDRIRPKQQEDRQHQHDHHIDRGAHRGPQQAQQALAQLRRQTAELGHQITAEVREISRQAMVQRPELTPIDPLLRRREQRRRGTEQLAELFDQERHQGHSGPDQKPKGH